MLSAVKLIGEGKRFRKSSKTLQICVESADETKKHAQWLEMKRLLRRLGLPKQTPKCPDCSGPKKHTGPKNGVSQIPTYKNLVLNVKVPQLFWYHFAYSLHPVLPDNVSKIILAPKIDSHVSFLVQKSLSNFVVLFFVTAKVHSPFLWGTAKVQILQVNMYVEVDLFFPELKRVTDSYFTIFRELSLPSSLLLPSLRLFFSCSLILLIALAEELLVKFPFFPLSPFFLR